jgi:hypothetical protein
MVRLLLHFVKFLSRLVLAALGGTLVLWLGVWWYQYVGPGRVASALELTSDRFRVVSGEAEVTAEGLLFHRLPPGKAALVLMGLTRLEAKPFVRLSWDINGLMAQQELAVIWVSSADPQQPHTRVITAEERARGSLILQDDMAWRDWILKFGVTLQGNFTESVLFKRITFQRAAPTPLNVLQSLAEDWTHHEPWTGRSINFNVGAPSAGLLLTPTTLVALWIGLSSLFFVLFSRCSPSRHMVWGLAILFLSGWLLLDFRWGWQLAMRLGETYARYGHLTPEQRSGAMPDAQIAIAVAQLHEMFPHRPGRIFILSKDPHSSSALRVRYHLLPYRVYTTDRLPNREQVQEGDYILSLANQNVIRYDVTKHQLSSRNGSLSVEPVGKVPGFGDLYRLLGEN